jgi:hypothetical protein
MPRTSPKLKATEPKNAFTKPLQVDVKELFKALSKGVGHTAIGKWEEIGNDTVEALCAIGLSTEPCHQWRSRKRQIVIRPDFRGPRRSRGKQKVLFVPLHLMDPSKDLVDEVGRFVRDNWKDDLKNFRLHVKLDLFNDNVVTAVTNGRWEAGMARRSSGCVCLWQGRGWRRWRRSKVLVATKPSRCRAGAHQRAYQHKLY